MKPPANPCGTITGYIFNDLNGNGIIDNGTELFGDQTGFENGFSYLSSFDDNNDRVIDANDKILDF